MASCASQFIDNLSENELRAILHRVAEGLEGDSDVMDGILCKGIDHRRSSVASRLGRALDDTDRSFLEGSCSEFGDIRGMIRTILSETVDGCCRSDVSVLLMSGRRSEAEEYISGMNDALLTSRCAMAEHCMEPFTEYSGWLEDNLRNGTPERCFDIE